MSGTPLLLVHAPLLGPSSWAPVRDVLASRGHDVALPDLRPAVTGDPAGWWDRAVALLPTLPGAVVVAHSGAGALVPLACRHSDAAGVVLVDAVLPVASGETRPAEELRTFVRGLVADDVDVLPPWSQWWGEQAMADLVPDPARRAALAADEPRLPVAFWDHAVPAPEGWPPRRVGYLRLSPAYDADADAAEARGWAVVRQDGTRLDPLTEPERVADAVVALAGVAR